MLYINISFFNTTHHSTISVHVIFSSCPYNFSTPCLSNILTTSVKRCGWSCSGEYWSKVSKIAHSRISAFVNDFGKDSLTLQIGRNRVNTPNPILCKKRWQAISQSIFFQSLKIVFRVEFSSYRNIYFALILVHQPFIG